MSAVAAQAAAIQAGLQQALSTLKVLCIALALTAVVLGIFLGQVNSYFRLFPKDRFRWLVVVLLVLELAYLSLFIANTYIGLSHLLEPPSTGLRVTSASIVAQNWLLAAITWVVEGYFTFLTLNVTESWLPRGVACTLWLIEFGTFLAWNVLSTIHRNQMGSYEQYVLRACGIWSLFAVATFTSAVLLYKLIVKRELRPSGVDALTKFATMAIGTSLYVLTAFPPWLGLTSPSSLLAVNQGIGAVASLIRDSSTARIMGIFLSNFYAGLSAVCVLWNLNHRASLREGLPTSHFPTSRPSGLFSGGSIGSRHTGSGQKTSSRWLETGSAQVQVMVEEQTREERGSEEEDAEEQRRERWKAKEEEDVEERRRARRKAKAESG
ncbi:hypothetical protein JCM8547_003210 [Rhodosporidiobolus lusitaniae]